MPFPPWQLIPPSTAVRDLYRTSLLVCTDEPGSGVLLRCNTGLKDGSATVVHAKMDRPNKVRMMGVDDDSQIAHEAQRLLGDATVHVVSIPHIAWTRLGGGLPSRTPLAVTIALLTATLLYFSPLPLTTWAAIPVATALGLAMWLLLRDRIPTRIGHPGSPAMTTDAIVERVMLSLNGPSLTGSATTRPLENAPEWAPHLL